MILVSSKAIDEKGSRCFGGFFSAGRKVWGVLGKVMGNDQLSDLQRACCSYYRQLGSVLLKRLQPRPYLDTR